MDEKNMVIIQNPDGNNIEVELLTYLIGEDNQKTYIVYSKGEKTGVESDEVIYISKVEKEKNILKLQTITDDDEWANVQKLLKKNSECIEKKNE